MSIVARIAWKNSKFLAISLLLFTVLTGLVTPAQLFMLGTVIQLIADGSSFEAYVWPIAILAGLMGIQSAQYSIRQFLLARMQTRLLLASEELVLNRIAAMEPQEVENPETRDQIQVAWTTASSRIPALVDTFIMWLAGLASVCGVIALLVAINPLVALLLIAAACVSMLGMPMMFRAIRKYEDESAKVARRKSLLSEFFLSPDGFFDTQASRSTRETTTRLLDLTRGQRAMWQTVANKESGWVSLIYMVGTALAVGAALLILAAQGVTVGQVAVVVGALTALGTLGSVVFSFTTILTESAHVGRLPELLGGLEPVGEDDIEAERVSLLGADEVTFKYPSRIEPAVRTVSATLTPGKMHAIVGLNGSGKTTLMRMLAGVYEPTLGEILKNEQATTGQIYAKRSGGIGYVSQEHPKPPITLREYLLAGNPGKYSDAEMHEALRLATVDKVLDTLPFGLDTRIGREFDDGAAVSGGQWQRIAIARMFLNQDYSVWILDEPTSALDPDAERRVFEVMRKNLGNRIGIIVSHRLWTVREADYVYVMNEGDLVQEGTFRDVHDNEGPFRELFAFQMSQ